MAGGWGKLVLNLGARYSSKISQSSPSTAGIEKSCPEKLAELHDVKPTLVFLTILAAGDVSQAIQILVQQQRLIHVVWFCRRFQMVGVLQSWPRTARYPRMTGEVTFSSFGAEADFARGFFSSGFGCVVVAVVEEVDILLYISI